MKLSDLFRKKQAPQRINYDKIFAAVNADPNKVAAVTVDDKIIFAIRKDGRNLVGDVGSSERVFGFKQVVEELDDVVSCAKNNRVNLRVSYISMKDYLKST